MPQNEARAAHPIRASTTLKRRIGVWAYRRDYVARGAVSTNLGPHVPDDPIPEQDAACGRRRHADTPIRR